MSDEKTERLDFSYYLPVNIISFLDVERQILPGVWQRSTERGR